MRLIVLTIFFSVNASHGFNDQASCSLMYQEAESTAKIVSTQQQQNKDKITNIAQQIKNFQPKFVVTYARGSSKNAALYAESLFASQLKLHAFSAKLSETSIQHINKDFTNTLVIAISQSGKSQDILENVAVAKAQGAFVVAIVNDVNSPLANLANAVLPTHASIENSVAATKTFTLTLTAVAQLIFTLVNNQQMLDELQSLTKHLKTAWELDWQQALADFDLNRSVYVISRGVGLAIAQEAALKLKETCGIHAEAFSAAEVKHGPLRLFDNNIGVLSFAPNDKNLASIIEITNLAKDKNIPNYLVSSYKHEHSLPYNNLVASELEPILMIHTFYRFVNEVAIKLNQNPDQPPMLNKVTSTL